MKRFREIVFKVKREVFPYLMRLRCESKSFSLLPTKKIGAFHYSVIITAHNSENYIDYLLESIASQSLEFSKNISVFVVNAGSTDRTLEKALNWSAKFSNIKVLSQDHSGISAARNLALGLIKDSWVFFIDGDDFISKNFCKSVDKKYRKISRGGISLLRNEVVLYDEKLKKNKRFLKDSLSLLGSSKINKISDKNSDIFFHRLAGLFFHSRIIKEKEISFNEDLKFNIADLDFIHRYLSSVPELIIVNNKNALYFLRLRKKRNARNNLMWEDKDKYLHDLKFGHLAMIKHSLDKNGIIPLYLQRSIWEDIFLYFVTLVKSPELLPNLEEGEVEDFEINLMNVLSSIDSSVIKSSDISHKFKIGILGRYKNEILSPDKIYVEDYDLVKGLVKLRFPSYFDELDLYLINGQDRPPCFIKKQADIFLSKPIFQEKIVWLRLDSSEVFSFKSSGKVIPIEFCGVERASLFGQDIVNFFKSIEIPKRRSIYRDSWIFLDRDTQADDNAEHLYRFILKNYPSVPAFFALRSTSHDWLRLKEEGFRLVDINSHEYRKAYRDCAKIISSHIDPYVVKLLGKNSLRGKQFIFLQHGVIKHDLSKWLNKKRVDCFVTSAFGEYESIAGDNSPYGFTKKEVLLSGLPRHDRLINQHPGKEEKIILVMPTWRMYLSGENIGKTNDRKYNRSFMESLYAKSWKSLLISSDLKALVDQYGYRIVFFPHANTQIYLKDFNLPAYIQVEGHKSGSIQDYFLKSKIMITDYSSVCFEMGIQKKEVIYYQFDEKEFFSGVHLYKKGFFDYKKDGFGPVCTDEKSVLKSLEEFFKHDGVPLAEYVARADKTFAHFDGNNCERVFKHIQSMDEAYPGEFDLSIAHERAKLAFHLGDVKLARVRYDKILASYPDDLAAARGIKLCPVDE